MPFVETTMIAGYGDDVKHRLITAFTRGVLSVMAAPPDGVIVVLREVPPSNWARGGVSRVPGPPLPYAIDVVRSFAAALAGGDGEAVKAALAEDVAPPDGAADYQRLDESYDERGSQIFAQGILSGAPVIDRFHVIAGKIVGHQRWGGATP